MIERDKYARELQIKEGWLCLDFANTASWHASEQPTNHLQSYADLVEWAQDKGILAKEEADGLLQEAKARSQAAEVILQRAIDLRETIYRIFADVAHAETLQPSDLAALNAALAESSRHFQVVPTSRGYLWDWQIGEDALEAMLWPSVRSAADLLTSGDLNRIGQCADDRGCGWLFFDTSKNRSRRWCSMEDCGNRAKARLHYSRARSAAPGKGT
jgi:predicted RNA-binding Zn ribbon-like protein